MIVLENVRKTYSGAEGAAIAALDVPSWRMPRGAQWALVGPSGSGKTTLLHVLAGIVAPDRGRVEIAGTDLASLGEGARDRFRARSIGIVFQTFNLLPEFTALENVLLAMLFAGRPDGGRAEALLRRVGLGDRLKHRPPQLSVGQQQRVAIARALANRPALVLADEPTGSLDEASAADVSGLLKEVCAQEQATLLAVTHDAGFAASFHRSLDVRSLATPAGEEVRS